MSLGRLTFSEAHICLLFLVHIHGPTTRTATKEVEACGQRWHPSQSNGSSASSNAFPSASEPDCRPVKIANFKSSFNTKLHRATDRAATYLSPMGSTPSTGNEPRTSTPCSYPTSPDYGNNPTWTLGTCDTASATSARLRLNTSPSQRSGPSSFALQ